MSIRKRVYDILDPGHLAFLPAFCNFRHAFPSVGPFYTSVQGCQAWPLLDGISRARVLPEIRAVTDRVETLWRLHNGILPLPLPEKPIWLKSDEAVYFQTSGQYLHKRQLWGR